MAEEIEKNIIQELPNEIFSTTTINGYEIYEVLGKGSFGQVFKAKKNGQIFALKLLDLNMIKQRKIERFVSNEINLMQRLNHKNVVKIYEVFQTISVIFLVLEFCNQGTLLAHVSKQKLNVDDCVDLLIQILAGIKHIHEKNILHRDLKPENIFLHDGIIKIADFGLAQFENDPFVYCGTSFYMAPEILLRKQVSNKSDLWSLGIIMFYMIFRRLPFNSKSSLLPLLQKWTNPYFNVKKYLAVVGQRVIIDDDLSEFFRKVLVFDDQKRFSFKDLYNLPLIQKRINEVDYKESYLFYSNLDNKLILNTPNINSMNSLNTPPNLSINRNKRDSWNLNNSSLSIYLKKSPSSPKNILEKSQEVEEIYNETLNGDLKWFNSFMGNSEANTEKDQISGKFGVVPSAQLISTFISQQEERQNIYTTSPLIQITTSSFSEDIPDDDSPNIQTKYPCLNITHFDKRREIEETFMNTSPDDIISFRKKSQSMDPQALAFLTPMRISSLDAVHSRVLSDMEPIQFVYPVKELSNQEIVNLSTQIKSSLFLSDPKLEEFNAEVDILKTFIYRYQLLEEIMNELQDLRLGYTTQYLLYYIISKMIVFLVSEVKQNLSNSQSIKMVQFSKTLQGIKMLSFVNTDLKRWENKLLVYMNGIDIENEIKQEELRNQITEGFGNARNFEEIVTPFCEILELLFGVSYQLSQHKQSDEAIRFKKYSLYIILVLNVCNIFTNQSLTEGLLQDYIAAHPLITPNSLLTHIQNINTQDLVDQYIQSLVHTCPFQIPHIKSVHSFSKQPSK